MRVYLTLILNILIYTSVDGQAPLYATTNPNDVVADRYMVVLNDGGTDETVITVARRAVDFADANGGYISIDKVYENVFKGFSADMDADVLADVRGYAEVEYVEQDAKIRGYNEQSHLDRIDQLGPTLDDIYQPIGDGAGIDVYIIDGGIMMDHEEVIGRVKLVPDHTQKCDFMQGEDATEAMDDICGKHGTAMAGIVGGLIYGVARGVTLWDVRVLTGQCDIAEGGFDVLSNAIHGMDMVLHSGGQKSAVVLLAFGTASEYVSTSYNKATTALYNMGYVVVGSAGNARRNACDFQAGGSEHVFTVGQSAHRPFAPMDMVVDMNYGPCVDIFAPGYNVQTASTQSTTYTQVISGTSPSAAIVAGVAAIIMAQSPTAMTPDEVTEAILNRAILDALAMIFPPMSTSPNVLAYIGP